MYYIVETNKSFNQASLDLDAAVKNHGFGVLRLNMALPCRISVFTEKGKTMIGLIKPMQMLSALSQDAALALVAKEVEDKTIQMVDEAK